MSSSSAAIKACLQCKVVCQPSTETVGTCSACTAVFCTPECFAAGFNAHKAACRRIAASHASNNRTCGKCGKGFVGGRGPICRLCGTVFCCQQCYSTSACAIHLSEVEKNIAVGIARLTIQRFPDIDKRREVHNMVRQAYYEIIAPFFNISPVDQPCASRMRGTMVGPAQPPAAGPGNNGASTSGKRAAEPMTNDPNKRK
ncbi:hypothetical protein COHA_007590 [Chlorella ohadii]|uniref:Uncharacterized protein n=1 Tax=Chlorella ohadii TaxID=2649997 RepID=A0AAD5DLZ1_9CHLO|nr:hypothetical protein COHA_007590 [Chlorella ohadii]